MPTIPVLDKRDRITRRNVAKKNLHRYVRMKQPHRSRDGRLRVRVFFLRRDDTLVVDREALELARGIGRPNRRTWIVTLRGHYTKRQGKDRRDKDWSLTCVLAGLRKHAVAALAAMRTFRARNAGALPSESDPVGGFEEGDASSGQGVLSVIVESDGKTYPEAAKTLRNEIEDAMLQAPSAAPPPISKEAELRLTARRDKQGKWRNRLGRYSKPPSSVAIV